MKNNEEGKDILIKTFLDNFIKKNKRERSYFELKNQKKRKKFVDRLNHNWNDIFEMKHLKEIVQSNDVENIKKQLKFREGDICYVISNYVEYDNKYFSFNEILEKIYWGGLGTILLNITGNILFLVTGQERGTSLKFVGKNYCNMVVKR